MSNCPHCGANWQGEPIPDDIAHHYAGTHWGREIGIDGGRLGIYDGVVAYLCPDCGETSPRNNSAWAAEMYEEYLAVTAHTQKEKKAND